MVTFSDFTTVGGQAYHMVIAQLFIYFYDSTCVLLSHFRKTIIYNCLNGEPALL